MNTKSFLFVPQNREHILNMNPVIDELNKMGFICSYLDTNTIFFQNLKYPKGVNITFFSKKNLTNPFYKISFIKRIKFLFDLRKTAKNIAQKYDSFVFGNDGAVQRQIIYYAKKEGKPCSMILDGLINPPISFGIIDLLFKSENKLSDLKEYLGKRIILFFSINLSKTFLSPYFPSIISCGNLNHIYTIGEFSTEEIKKYALKSAKVFNTGLPRMIPYFENAKKTFIPKRPNSVCFITSAYKWHGMHTYHNFQIKDILLIEKCLKEIYPNNKVPLFIKLHPREQEEDYRKFKEMDCIHLIKDQPFVETMKNYRVLISNLSTCIIEGYNYGIEIPSLMANFPFWKIKKGFLKKRAITKIFSEIELKDYLKARLESDQVEYKHMEENIFLSKNTVSSTKSIANNLITLL